MPVLVTCDHCRTQLQVMDDHLGKQVRCPKCYQVFLAKSGPAAEAAAPPSVPAGGSCAGCGTALVANARFCVTCGRAADGGAAPSPVAGQVVAPSFPGQAPGPVYTPRPDDKCGLATAALVCGILSFCVGGPVAAVPAIICGHLAHKQIRDSGGVLQGDQQALWGLVLGYINILLSCGWFGLMMTAAAAGGHP